MSHQTPNPIAEDDGPLSREELMSALFANLIVQQTNMALVFLGKVPHPQTGQPVQDLDAAQMFIDQLEMLALKTRGNLTKDEDQLLQQSLMSLRMAFVEAVDKRPGDAAPSSQAKPPTPEPPSSGSDMSSPAAPAPIVGGDSGSEESRKRFTKKYE